MKTKKSVALAAAFLLVANVSLAIDQTVDHLVHELEGEVDNLLHEVHRYHPDSHLDTDIHEVQEAVAEFHEHVAHGDSRAELNHLARALREAVSHMRHTANTEIGHYDTEWVWVAHGLFRGRWEQRQVWHSELASPVRRELQHVLSVYNSLDHTLRHGSHFHPHH